jgi:hypothetical protein
MAKILKRRGKNIEAGRGAGRNGHLGDAFFNSGAGKEERISLSLMVAFAAE